MFNLWFLVLVSATLSAGEKNMFDEKKIKEGKCLAVKEASNLDKELFMEAQNKGLHYVMSSRHHASAVKDSLTGQPAKDLDSLNDGCVDFIMYNEGNNFRISGFGNKADYELKTIAGKKEFIPSLKSTNFMWAAKRGTSLATVVWTDNKKYFLGVRCLAMNKVWSLKSTEPTLDDETKATVLAYIKEKGFNPDFAVVWPQDGCKDIVEVPED